MDPRGAKRVALCGSRYSSTAVLPQLSCFVVLAAVNGEYRRFEGFAFKRLPGSNNKRETFSPDILVHKNSSSYNHIVGNLYMSPHQIVAFLAIFFSNRELI